LYTSTPWAHLSCKVSIKQSESHRRGGAEGGQVGEGPGAEAGRRGGGDPPHPKARSSDRRPNDCQGTKTVDRGKNQRDRFRGAGNRATVLHREAW